MHPATSYILDTPEPYQSILAELKHMVEKTVPQAELSMKWGLPFYDLHGKMFCFLNNRKTFVDLGFIYGQRIEEHFPQLVAGEKRKHLRSLRFYNIKDIDPELVREVVLSASQL